MSYPVKTRKRNRVYRSLNRQKRKIPKTGKPIRRRKRTQRMYKGGMKCVSRNNDSRIQELEQELRGTKQELIGTKQELAETKQELEQTKQELAQTKQKLATAHESPAETHKESESMIPPEDTLVKKSDLNKIIAEASAKELDLNRLLVIPIV